MRPTMLLRSAEADMGSAASLGMSSARKAWTRWPAVGLLALGLWQSSFAQTVPVTSPSSRSITEWLTRMHEASRQRAYTGTLVVSAGSAMSASRIWHGRSAAWRGCWTAPKARCGNGRAAPW